MSTRRDLLTALIALAAAPGLGVVAAPFSDLDRDAVRRIGQAWRDSHPGATSRTLSARLFPTGRGPEALLQPEMLFSFITYCLRSPFVPLAARIRQGRMPRAV